MRFYTGSMFPAEPTSNAIFVARHGSWNERRRSAATSWSSSSNKDGSVKSMEPFITGFIEDNNYIGRPVDVMQ